MGRIQTISTYDAEPTDLAFIQEIDSRAINSESRYGQLRLSVEKHQCLIAKLAETICGFLVFSHSFFGHAFIELLIIDPGHQRKGAGTALINHYEKTAGSGKIFTSTNRSNTKMLNLLYKLGYKDSGIIYNLDEKDPELIYFKEKHASD